MLTERRMFGVFLLLVTVLVGSLTSAQADQIRTATFGGLWQGGAYSNGKTGRFSHCTAYAPYKSGITLFTTVDRDYGWSLGFAHNDWNLEVGRKIPVTVTFDSLSPWTGHATVILRNLVTISMANDSALIQQFRGAYQMRVLAEGRSYAFNLDGTSHMLLGLAQCVRDELTVERNGPRTPDTTTAFRPQPTKPSMPPPADAASPELAALRIASNLLLQAKIPNARILPSSETPSPFKGRGVVWASDIGVGFVTVIPKGAGTSSKDVAASLIDDDARNCKGDYASGRSSDNVNDRPVVKAMSSCKDSKGVSSLTYFVMETSPSGYVIFAVSRGNNPEARGADSPLRDSQFQLAAVRAAYSN